MIAKSTLSSVLIILLLCCEGLYAQTLFTRVFGGSSYDTGAEVIQTPDGGYLVAGTTGSFGVESGQVLLFKTDTEGYVEWRRFYGGDYADQAVSMELSADGNLIIAGNTETAENSYQAYAIKLNMDGDTLWTRNYGGPDWDFCRQVTALPDSGFALFGQTYSSGEGDFFLVRIDGDGDTLWTKTYGGPALESGESISQPVDGGFYLAGYTESYGDGMTDMYIIRTDENGDTIWTKTYGGTLDDFCYSVATTADTGYVLAGGTYNNTPGLSDMVVRKESNAVSWVKHEPRSSSSFFTDVIIEPGSGNVTCVGYEEGGAFGKEDARIIRFGGLDGIWNGMARSHGSAENDRFVDVKLCSDNGYVMAGYTQGYLDRFDDVYLVRGDNNGIAVQPELGINELEIGGNTFKTGLGPNPFRDVNPSFNIENFQTVASSVGEPISLLLFNSLGQNIIAVPVVSGKTELNLESLKAGIYHYQLKTANRLLATGKAIKLN